MTCREVVEFLMAYLSHELSAEEQHIFDEHLALCPPCVNYLDTYRQTIRLSKEACRCPDGPAEDEVPNDLIQAILAARRQSL